MGEVGSIVLLESSCLDNYIAGYGVHYIVLGFLSCRKESNASRQPWEAVLSTKRYTEISL